MPRTRLTTIIATLGPATSDEDAIAAMIEAGASIFRLNFSHGEPQEHAARLAAVRRASERCGRPIGVLGDLQGPKIRCARIAGAGAALVAGEEVFLVRGDDVVDSSRRPLRLGSTYAGLVEEVQPGHRVLLDDGAIRLLAVERDRDQDGLRCTVVHGGLLLSRKGINLPDTEIRLPALDERDLDWVEWAIRNDIDFLGLSFVQGAGDIDDLRRRVAASAAALGLHGFRMSIVAKIERPKAVENIEAIAQAADAVMIARGDLGVELDLAQVPVIQKRLIKVCRSWGRPTIVATQMLQGMIESPIPTRAEASDVANAILEGADAVMLSGETAIGRYPAIAVETMRRIAQAVEAWVVEQPLADAAPTRLVESGHRTAALAHGVWYIARDNRAKCLVVWSQAGGGARYLSQNEFTIPIAAFSSDRRALRQMALLRGVYPVLLDPPPSSLGAWTEHVDRWLVEHAWATAGDRVVMIGGSPLGVAGVTNSIALHEVGRRDTGFR
ncbi:MAG TPA: pyruvate kinase [Phycisphaerales bacterium]|nr:pyruvate kinase [Phycisphaerales bacterium]HMP37966.1 pyruvate kinase [Phycisphaerales bacterium]